MDLGFNILFASNKPIFVLNILVTEVPWHCLQMAEFGLVIRLSVKCVPRWHASVLLDLESGC